MMSHKSAEGAPVVEGDMPELRGATTWLNSKPLTKAALRGKVVVVDFWTYSCINCLRALPYINAWYEHYKDSGLVVIGVHSPEFGFEKDGANVRMAVQKFGITYPVAMDSDMARSERTIRQLLAEAGVKNLPEPLDDAAGAGISAASDTANVGSPETYVGFERAANFASPGSFARDTAKDYEQPKSLALNQWALGGRWRVGGERATLVAAPGRIVFRFRARDLHLVLGPGKDGKPARFRVTLDGKAPADDHGVDTDAQGNGTVREQRLYQLIRQKGAVGEHEFAIEFLDANVEAYSFTFG
jgi:thiol-disulfide isomerase/thioredoxin